jgi:hypothetical protein
MTSDVYAGDDALSSSAKNTQEKCTFRYIVSGDAQPDLLLRVCAQLLLANELPTRVVLARQTPDRATIEIEFTGINALLAESISRKISQLTCVDGVRIWAP